MSGRPQQAATGLPARPLLAALVVLALQRHHTSSLAPQREFATTHDDDHSEYRVCSTCKDWLVAGKVTAMSVTYDYRRYQPKPDHLPELNSVEAAAQCDKSTWFFCPSASKCTQADIGHINISTCTQYEDPTLVRHAPFLLEQPQTKKVPVVRGSSRPPGQVQHNSNSDKAVGGDHKPSTTVPQGKKSSPSVTTARTRMPYACAVCSLEFQQVSDLAAHTDMCPWPVPVQCGVCPYMCENWNATRIHMTTHIRKAPAKCPMCNYRLSGRNWLSVRHLLDHVAVKQYSCNMCGAEFVCGQDLSRHNVQRHIGQNSALRRRTSGKMHKCDICSAGFAYTRALMSHMRSHAETKVGQLQVTLPGPLQVVVPRAGLTMGLQASHVPET